MPKQLKATLDFLEMLGDHNDREWFTTHRGEYDTARGACEDFFSEVIDAVGEFEDLTGVTCDECMFRIYRDTRFSSDKRPYKTAMSAVIGRGGRKPVGPSYYLHIEPGNHSMVAGGLHSPTSAELDRVRRVLAEDATPLRTILADTEFVSTFGALEGESLKTAPQGYAKDHPDIDLLRRKQFLAFHALRDTELLAKDAVAHVASVSRVLQPFVTYLHQSTAE